MNYKDVSVWIEMKTLKVEPTYPFVNAISYIYYIYLAV